jgi:hypothetical protein
VLRRKPLVVALMAMLVALVALSGCERKAPGPAECLAFAYHIHGVTNGQDVRLARVRAEVDELTRECLVTPYDREYLRCILESGRVRWCQAAFALRQKE